MWKSKAPLNLFAGASFERALIRKLNRTPAPSELAIGKGESTPYSHRFIVKQGPLCAKVIFEALSFKYSVQSTLVIAMPRIY